MEFKSINPYNDQQVGQFISLTEDELDEKLNKSETAFQSWKKVPIVERCLLIKKAGQVLRDNVEEYAKMITLEMGKPISESRNEVNKCASVCDYYADNGETFLADEVIATDAVQSFVKNEPIGAVFAIMPWNFPFWQVFRYAAPTLIAGNTGLLKHAPNVFGCATLIEEVFTKAGVPEGVFQNLIIHHEQTEKIIAHNAVQAVTLTGSEKAGSAVAEIAGRHIKKTVLELGGNNAFIVWEDADIDQSVQIALTARMLNCGQSCIAAKRFILMEPIYDEFVAKFIKAVVDLKSGDPIEEKTKVGPLARKDLADQLNRQVKESVKLGAKLVLGGTQKECYHEPTVLGDVTPGMPAFDEETFGPLAAMIKAKDIAHAFTLSEQSKYGLGVTVCTKNIEKAIAFADKVSDGAYFINELVKSDPRLPFGGTKRSGYGRELAKDGIFEFVNRKTIYVKK
ncbi:MULTISPECIES: NAD-dependent succinate-semialdehyde dehydrogenase [unclassified Polaribacter]|uniref:NAD-dependent succinate-semialdehyde dehydrogenase n=1 Tax=unclassified Polaribacter TaxID=196858 RepID=UPI0011BE82CC|nr:MULTISPECIES: NAD-dependent succinate-semialdehyde dehydrogenase [unclassified Polaribacter]TXD52116.1 NAD-dependent succinate-semialdehyde dehydrogenase [Polaribacter sp. IC063]TXD59970.1 NAD-dependent succinate-semialdehyde dehydrogenase [Polaribacter sp. IC066]